MHGVGYEILGKRTVLYNKRAPCLEGDVASREFEKSLDFDFSISNCLESVRSHDFQTPRYLECSIGGFTFIGVGDIVDGFIIVGLKDWWQDIDGWPCLLKYHIMGIV